MKWNWQAALGWVCIIFAATKISGLLSVTANSTAAEWGDAAGVGLALCGGVWLVVRSRKKVA
jgi:hypothetical protein